VRRTEEAHRRILGELAREPAAALGRAGEPIEDALVEAARARAARLALVMQRDALGLRHHRVVEQQCLEPPRRPTPRRTP